MNAPPASYPSGLRRIQRFMQTDGEALRHTQERLRDLAQRASNDVTLVCSHDLRELENCQRAAERRERRERTPAAKQPGGAV